MTKAIELQGVTKSYSGKTVLKNLNLSINQGCCYGFLGRNGSGKTTTIRIIMGLISHEAGTVKVMGQNSWNIGNNIKEKIGYVSEKQILPENLSVRSITSFSEKIYPNWNREKVKDLLDRFNIPENKKIKNLSQGMQKFLALVLVLGQEPELLVFDEPASGLDPIARQEFIDNVMNLLLQEKKTVFFSSHLLSDVEKIADTIGILKDGSISIEMELDEMKQSIKQIQIDFADGQYQKFEMPNIISERKIGNSVILTVRDCNEDFITSLKNKSKIEPKILDMNFEEIFIALAK